MVLHRAWGTLSAMRRAIGAPSLVIVALALACTRPTPSPAPGSLPPSGYYDARYDVTTWGCQAPKPSSITMNRIAVTTHIGAGGTVVSVPLWEDAMANGAFTPAAASDLPLRRGEKRTIKARPTWNCPGSEDTFETEVADVSHDQLRLKVTRIYGDTSVCSNRRADDPSRCRAEASVVLTLVEGKCELPCTGREAFTGAGSHDAQMKCSCAR